MKRNKSKLSMLLLCLMAGSAVTSCVDADIDDALEYKDTYTNVNDADKHILGIYSKFMELGEQMVVLGELRGDLMDITDNSNTYLQEVAAKVDDSANPYLDPTPYYSVINECNDCLHNFDLMKERHDMTEDEYNERYSDIAALRCYVYLQLAIQFGKVPYITDPIVSVNDMKTAEQNAEWLSLDALLPRLISVMESLPFLNQYEESSLVLNPVTGANTTLNGEQLSYYFVYKKLLLADLYLWNSQYREAAALYKEVMDIDSDEDDANNYERYKCCRSSSKDALSLFYEASLSRFQEPNVNSYTTLWPTMFSDELTAKRATYEWIWAITYPTGTTPQYPFVSLFASTDEGGNYQLKPSSSCLYNFNRLDRTRQNDSPYDTRGNEATYRVTASGDTVCAKYLYMYDPAVPYEQEGRLWLYRAPMVHLRYAECMNRLGYPKLAWSLVIKGLVDSYGTSYPSDVTRTSDMRDYRGKNSIFDLQYPITMGVTVNPGYEEADSALLYFDTRFYTTNAANPYDGYARRGPWRQSYGIRNGRACMNNVTDANFSSKTLATCATREDSIYLVEKILMDEAALELAHEGNRFGDLVRVARRMNREGNDGMSGTEYFKAVMDRKAQGSKNVLGVPDYSAGENSWFLTFH
jgi:hypothetical protein